MPTDTLRDEIRRPARRRRSLYGLLLHPAVWAVGAAVIGLGLGVLVDRFRVRYFKLIVGALFALAALRSPTYIGIGLFLIIYSYPSALWIGDTNFALLVFLAVVWMGRVVMRYDPAPRRTYLDWAVLFYIGTLCFAFVHVETSQELRWSWKLLQHLVTPILMYYIVVNAARDERRMLFLTEMFLLGLGTVFLSVMLQRHFPGLSWLPRGYLTALGARGLFATEAVARIGGVYTHALLSDATAIAFLLRIYLAVYYKHNRFMRYYHYAFALLSVYVLSLTGNRGGLLLLMGGLLYFLWIFRRQFTPFRVLVGGIVLALLFVGSEYILFEFQGEGSLLGRLFRTQLVRGIPDTRVKAWNYIWDQIAASPWIGHGLVYRIGTEVEGLNPVWPHCAYFFYLQLTGVIGLTAFLIICWRVLRRTWVGHNFAIYSVPLSRGLTAVFHVGFLQFLAGQVRTDHQRTDLFVYVMWAIIALGIMCREVWERERTGAGRPGARARLESGPLPARTARADARPATGRTG